MIDYVTSAAASVTGASSAISFSVAMGDVIVVAFGLEVMSTNTPVVSDNGGNNYNLQTLRIATPSTALFTAKATASATSITLNWPSATRRNYIIAKYTGVYAIKYVGQFTEATTNAQPCTFTQTLDQAVNWLVGVVSTVATGQTLSNPVGNQRNTANFNYRMYLLDETGSPATIGMTTSWTSSTSTQYMPFLMVELQDVPQAPTLDSISPAQGAQSAAVNVTLSGGSLMAATGIVVSGTGVTVSNFVAVNSTTVTATFTIAAGATLGDRQVHVTSSNGDSNDLVFTVVAPAPVITEIDPQVGAQGSTVVVTITGYNLLGATLQATPGLNFTNVTVVSSTEIRATMRVSRNATDPQTITVVTPSGFDTVGFRVEGEVPPGNVTGLIFTKPWWIGGMQ